MKRLQLEITDQKLERFGETMRFRIRGNGILFEQLAHREKFNDKQLAEINDNFRNSLRIVKHTGGWLRDDSEKSEVEQIMNKLSSTNTGVGIRIKDDPLPEFVPFEL